MVDWPERHNPQDIEDSAGVGLYLMMNGLEDEARKLISDNIAIIRYVHEQRGGLKGRWRWNLKQDQGRSLNHWYLSLFLLWLTRTGRDRPPRWWYRRRVDSFLRSMLQPLNGPMAALHAATSRQPLGLGGGEGGGSYVAYLLAACTAAEELAYPWERRTRRLARRVKHQLLAYWAECSLPDLSHLPFGRIYAPGMREWGAATWAKGRATALSMGLGHIGPHAAWWERILYMGNKISTIEPLKVRMAFPLTTVRWRQRSEDWGLFAAHEVTDRNGPYTLMRGEVPPTTVGMGYSVRETGGSHRTLVRVDHDRINRRFAVIAKGGRVVARYSYPEYAQVRHFPAALRANG